jgi:hypothetical protein
MGKAAGPRETDDTTSAAHHQLAATPVHIADVVALHAQRIRQRLDR